MESHYDLTDDEFEVSFANCAMAEDVFTHEAHIRLAWIHLRKYGSIRAIQNVSLQIMNFARNIGMPQIFDLELTVAAVKIVDHFMKEKECSSFEDFIHENPRLVVNMKGLLHEFYGLG